MQDKIKINSVEIKQPDTYKAVFATTSTDDSIRDMALIMHNTPIGTVEGYDLTWSNLTASEMKTIMGQVLNKASFTVHYFDLITGSWRDGDFYASNFNAPALTLEDGAEVWDELSFNIIGVNPR